MTKAMSLKKRREAPAYQCLECGKKMSYEAAERAVNEDGCPKCGGVDIDLASMAKETASYKKEST